MCERCNAVDELVIAKELENKQLRTANAALTEENARLRSEMERFIKERDDARRIGQGFQDDAKKLQQYVWDIANALGNHKDGAPLPDEVRSVCQQLAAVTKERDGLREEMSQVRNVFQLEGDEDTVIAAQDAESWANKLAKKLFDAREELAKIQKRFAVSGAKTADEIIAKVDEMHAIIRNLTPVKTMAAQCKIPPEGWRCTRAPGHDGPCAAIPDEAALASTDQPGPIIELTEKGREELRKKQPIRCQNCNTLGKPGYICVSCKQPLPEQPGREEKLWCAMCGKMTDHQSGSCPELAHFRKPSEGGAV